MSGWSPLVLNMSLSYVPSVSCKSSNSFKLRQFPAMAGHCRPIYQWTTISGLGPPVLSQRVPPYFSRTCTPRTNTWSIDAKLTVHFKSQIVMKIIIQIVQIKSIQIIHLSFLYPLGGFLKCGYPEIIHFNGIVHFSKTIQLLLGVPPFQETTISGFPEIPKSS